MRSGALSGVVTLSPLAKRVEGRAVFGRYWPLAAFVPGRRLLIAVSVVGVISGLAQAGFVVLLGRIAAALAKGETQTWLGDSLGFAFGVGALLLLAMAVSFVTFSWLSARLLGDSTRRARARAVDRLLRATWEQQSEERPGEFQEVVNGHVNRIGLGVNAIGQVLLAAINVIILFAVAVVVSPLAAVLVVIASGPLFLVLRPAIDRVSRYAAQRGDAAIALGASVSQTVSMTRDISVFGVEDPFRQDLDLEIEALTTPVMKGHFFRVLVPFLFQIAIFVLVLTGLVAAWLLDIGDLEGLSITVLLFLRAMMHGRDLQRSLVVVADAIPFVNEYNRRVAQFEPADVTANSAAQSTGHSLGSVATNQTLGIELRNYSYQYPQGGTPALREVSVAACNGDAIGIVGPSGSGKSTLAEILLRLRIGTGEYLVNGVPVGAIPPEEWSEQVAYVSQRPALLHASVRENIRFRREHITDDAVVRAAKLAYIHEEVGQLPDGYDTLLGGLQGQVSGGQAQRICIARALAGDPVLLVLDEPTSALDSRSETKIQEVLQNLKGKVTTFVITHPDGGGRTL